MPALGQRMGARRRERCALWHRPPLISRRLMHGAHALSIRHSPAGACRAGCGRPVVPQYMAVASVRACLSARRLLAGLLQQPARAVASARPWAARRLSSAPPRRSGLGGGGGGLGGGAGPRQLPLFALPSWRIARKSEEELEAAVLAGEAGSARFPFKVRVWRRSEALHGRRCRPWLHPLPPHPPLLTPPLPQDEFEVAKGSFVSGEQVVGTLSPLMTAERVARIEAVCAARTFNVLPIVEHIYDMVRRECAVCLGGEDGGPVMHAACDRAPGGARGGGQRWRQRTGGQAQQAQTCTPRMLSLLQGNLAAICRSADGARAAAAPCPACLSPVGALPASACSFTSLSRALSPPPVVNGLCAPCSPGLRRAARGAQPGRLAVQAGTLCWCL